MKIPNKIKGEFKEYKVNETVVGQFEIDYDVDLEPFIKKINEIIAYLKWAKKIKCK